MPTISYSTAGFMDRDVEAALDAIAAAGFQQVRIRVQASSRGLVEDWSPGSGAAQVVASALIEATKPA